MPAVLATALLVSSPGGAQRRGCAGSHEGFLARLIEKHDVRQASPDRGRFRSFLLGALKHYVQNEAQRLRAQKRGGGTSVLSLEFDAAEGGYRLDAADTETPEAVFERRWALTLIERVLQAMRRRAEVTGRDSSAISNLCRHLRKNPAGHGHG